MAEGSITRAYLNSRNRFRGVASRREKLVKTGIESKNNVPLSSYTLAPCSFGIIGATVMPHNLYLHSALVQSRKLQKDEPSIRSAIRFNGIDSIVALTIAFFVNAAILVLAATVFL
jgi:NRAMP (natural resistance-associated macrophage protein)-like metal ion transporter